MDSSTTLSTLKVLLQLAATRLGSFILGTIFGLVTLQYLDSRTIELGKVRVEISPTHAILPLPSFSDVLRKATEVVSFAQSELWVAVDVPTYGAASDNAVFKTYKEALITAARTSNQINVLWYGPEVEDRYNRSVVGNLNDAYLTKITHEQKEIRDLFGNAVTTDLTVLAHNNFWVSKDSSGKERAVVAWIKLNEHQSSEVFGFYTESQEIVRALKRLWSVWKDQSESNFSRKLLKLYPEESSEKAECRSVENSAVGASLQPPAPSRMDTVMVGSNR